MIKKEFPPNYRDILDTFGDTLSEAIFCYGEHIYNPHGRNVTPDLEAHEEAHMKQQGDNPKLWWDRYLTDKDFRLKQEIEAYGTQYAFVKNKGKMPNRLLSWGLDNMAVSLASETYGNIINFQEARSKIRNFAKNL